MKQRLISIVQKFNFITSVYEFVKAMLTPTTSDRTNKVNTLKGLSVLSRVLVLVGAFSNYTFVTNMCNDYFAYLLGTAYYINQILGVFAFFLVIACIDLTMAVFSQQVITSVFSRDTWRNIAAGTSTILLLGIVIFQCTASMHFSKAGNAAVIAQTYRHEKPKGQYKELIALDSAARAAKAEIQARWSSKIKAAQQKDEETLKDLKKQATQVVATARHEAARKYGSNPQYNHNKKGVQKMVDKAKKDSTAIMESYQVTADPLAYLQNNELNESAATFGKSRKELEESHTGDKMLHDTKMDGVLLIFSTFTSYSSLAAIFVIFIMVLIRMDSSVKKGKGGNDADDIDDNEQVRKIVKKLSEYITRFNDARTARPHPNLESLKTNGLKLIELYTELNTLDPKRFNSLMDKYGKERSKDIYLAKDIFQILANHQLVS